MSKYFDDIPEGHYAEKTVDNLHELGLINGIGNNKFGGDLLVDGYRLAATVEKLLLYNSQLVPNKIKMLKPSIVVVKNQFEVDGKPKNSIGTGTAITNDNIILTNYHCIADGDDPSDNITVGILEEASSTSNEKIKYYDAEFVCGDKFDDLACIKIKDVDFTLTPIPISQSNLEEGEKILAYGHGGGYLYAGVVGHVAQDNQVVGLWGMGQTDAAINPGNSGGYIGKVYGVDNVLAGVPSRKRVDMDNISFYINAGTIRYFLNTNKVDYILE